MVNRAEDVNSCKLDEEETDKMVWTYDEDGEEYTGKEVYQNRENIYTEERLEEGENK